jgi:hypothetical protein
MARGAKVYDQLGRQIFVQLESHTARSGIRLSSCANSAA